MQRRAARVAGGDELHHRPLAPWGPAIDGGQPGFWDSRGAEELAVAISSGTLREVDEIAVELVRLWGAEREPQ